MLSSILARVALEKENKNLKDEANKKERAEELKVIGKSTQKVVKMHMLSQKTTKKCEKRIKNAYVIICTLYFLIYRCTTFLKDDEYSKDINDQSVQHQFQDHLHQNLHLKLKMKKSVYKSYRVINY